MGIKELREKANRLPPEPGVYLMTDDAGEVIYVGKAKALRSRVSQYFQESAGHDEKTRRMVSQVRDFDVILASTEFEALVLENSLIKRHMPRYNILLKDGKGYPFLRLSAGEEYPRFSLASRQEEDGARYFGPYGGRVQTRGVIDAIRAALRLPSCSRSFPRDIGRERPCLNLHMGLCDGYCREPGAPERYRAAIGQAILLLEGKYEALHAALREEMERAAEELRFERAAELRDRLRAVEALGRRQHVISGTGADTDAIGFTRGDVKCALAVLHYVDGALAGCETELFDTPAEAEGTAEAELMAAAVTQYYTGRGFPPCEILLPDYAPDMPLIERLLTERAGRRVTLRAGVRGQRREYVRLAARNAREAAERATTQEARVSKLIFALQKLLDTERPPMRIEAFDISHTAGKDAVASMTVFENTKPKKRDYRHFQIKHAAGGDDCGALAEVIARRAARWREGDEAFGARPDLLLLDGGAAQARAARGALEAAGLHIPVFGMVKDGRHHTRALETPEGREIGLQGNPALFAFFGRMQEETHRFAVEYHRERRSKQLRRSALDGIPGVGEARKTALLKHFGSVKAIRAATPEALAEILPKNTARAVYEQLHKDKEGDAPCESSPEARAGEG